MMKARRAELVKVEQSIPPAMPVDQTTWLQQMGQFLGLVAIVVAVFAVVIIGLFAAIGYYFGDAGVQVALGCFIFMALWLVMSFSQNRLRHSISEDNARLIEVLTLRDIAIQQSDDAGEIARMRVNGADGGMKDFITMLSAVDKMQKLLGMNAPKPASPWAQIPEQSSAENDSGFVDEEV